MNNIRSNKSSRSRSNNDSSKAAVKYCKSIEVRRAASAIFLVCLTKSKLVTEKLSLHTTTLTKHKVQPQPISAGLTGSGTDIHSSISIGTCVAQ